MLVVGVGLYQAVRLGHRSGTSLDPSATACAIGVLTIALMMTVIPYRIAWQPNLFPRAQFDGMRCYVLGQNAQNHLLYCPESAVPHNQTVARTDKRFHPEVINESLFTPAGQAAPPPQ
jgi:hypothetical protein